MVSADRRYVRVKLTEQSTAIIGMRKREFGEVGGKPIVMQTLETEDLGNSENVLRDQRHLADTAQKLIKRGVVPTQDGWGGWLGRYQAALRETALRLEQEREQAELTRRQAPQRDRDRSRGR